MLDVHLVSHTHWDREWYHPAEVFRQRLVALIDELLDDPPPVGQSFLLDGQAIVLEDYLAVRPDRRLALENLLGESRLEAGPWYVLADELIPGGEALVRNLLTGARVLRRLGAAAPPVLYCPDSFGHPAALPTIAAGFGFPVIVLWRGYGSSRFPSGDTALWAAPNGDEALLYHLPRDGYEFGSHLPADPAAAADRWRRMRDELAPRSTTGIALVTNGADHHARQRDLRSALSALEHAADVDRVHPSSLRSFAERLASSARRDRLATVRGELRDSYGYAWTLQGTFGTRAHEKRLNALAERALVRDAEPWDALAARVRDASRRWLLDEAWRTLLTAHPHDTLCGCSIDQVAAAMELRLQSARNQAAAVRDDAIAQLIGHDRVLARASRESWQPIVVIRNPAPRPRSGVVTIEIEELVADVPVGPGSARLEPAPAPPLASRPRIPALGALQVLSRSMEHRRLESPQHYPDNDLVRVTRVAAWVPELPPYGIASYAVGAGGRGSARPTEPVRVDRNALRNLHLAVRVSDDGTVSLETRHGARHIESLFAFEDQSDVGDLYTPAPRQRSFRVQYRGCRRVDRGPLRGTLALSYRIAGDDRGDRIADVALQLILDADVSFLRLHVAGENYGRDHRLRLRIASDVRIPQSWADAAFGPVRRERLLVQPADEDAEQVVRTAPLHRYASLFDADRGFSLYSDGLAEYESFDDGALAVTLVRAVGELSRNDLPERPGHAGWPTPTPDAQCRGPFAARLAVFLHGGRSVETLDRIERTADDVLCAPVGTTLRSALTLPAPVAGVALSGDGLAFSAVKESEDGQWIVLRCINVCDEPVDGVWTLPFDVHDARLARLDETPIAEIDAVARAVHFRAGARDVATILVR
ncbi:MAG TPA: glycoside hydrolase family 38 C-terminal domain-containing protein [Gemmatimonadaceae bacterium]|nr:glycoside hydrolase family 38 C-terminal domain-containing protein [Gemmatimonadaceae bacterium]